MYQKKSHNTTKNVFIIGVVPSSLVNFRGELIKAIKKKSHQITALAGSEEPEVTDFLKKNNVNFIAYPVKRKNISPSSDLKTLNQLKKIFQKEKPDIIIAYTIKPIIWGGLASFFVPKSHFYAIIEGTGYTFQGTSWQRRLLTYIVSKLYCLALKKATKVIFLNPDDIADFVKRKIISKHKTCIINGIGVDLDFYNQTPLPSKNQITFLTIGRLLGEKGFRKYVEAAKIVKSKYIDINFQLIGEEDSSSDAIPINEVRHWHQKGWIEYLGTTNDVRSYISNSHIFVLPSYYREGLPRTLLEAMSMGRPILTTDNVGCRETVIPGENGYLVPKADAQALAERMIWFIENRDQWERMGKRSRELAEEKYDVHKINAQLMEIMGL